MLRIYAACKTGRLRAPYLALPLMKLFFASLFLLMTVVQPASAQPGRNNNQLAADWLYKVRVGLPADTERQALAIVKQEDLKAELRNDDARKAFWINVYNAAVQSALKANPEKYKSRNAFFGAPLVTIAGKALSLDKIEHGILRRSKIKLSYGYLNKLFPGRFEKAFRVDKLDPRLHFALNCGARSCPPIAYYTVAGINGELQSAMLGHLRAETDYDSVKNTAAVTAFMGWFRADFKGKKGIRKLLQEAGAVPPAAQPKIVFKKYDWDLYLDNFTEEN